MTGVINTTSPKPRTQVIYGTWEVDGQTYKGRRIDVDTLCHLEWIDETPPSVTEASIDYLLLKPLTRWEYDFINQLATCLVKGWQISDKRLAVWHKICLKLKVTAKDVGETVVSDASGSPMSHGKERGGLSSQSESLPSTTSSVTPLPDGVDELPF